MLLERGGSQDFEYKVDESWDGPGPGVRYRVTAHLKAVSQDGSEQTKLAMVLIQAGVLTKTHGFEFQIFNNEILVVFNAVSRAIIHIHPPIESAQMILNGYISRALDLASFIDALQMSGRCKIG